MIIHRIIIALIISAVLLSNVQFAISEPVDNNTILIFIESRFRLWDENEKMMDNNFTISFFAINQSVNNTYKITINQDIITGNFTGYYTRQFETNDSVISIHIEINDIPLLTISNIKIVSNITAGGISQIGEPFKISLSPFDWNKKQWNIFYSVVIAAVISVIVSYLLIMRYRKINGVMEIK